MIRLFPRYIWKWGSLSTQHESRFPTTNSLACRLRPRVNQGKESVAKCVRSWSGAIGSKRARPKAKIIDVKSTISVQVLKRVT
jgi:hypothetical protein